MDWHKIKNSYPDSWYSLIDYLADPGIYKERRIRIEGNTVAADTKESAAGEDGDWYEIDSLHTRDLWEFFEQNGIFVVILYDEWLGFFSYEIYSELKNETSRAFESRKEAELHAFTKAFSLMEKQILLV